MSTLKARSAAPKAKAPKAPRLTPDQRLAKYLAEQFTAGATDADCKLFKGRVDGSNGYPIRKYLGKTMTAAKAAYLLANGPNSIPKNKCVLHRCDDKRCANLDHLYIGTRQDNSKDAAKAKALGRRVLTTQIAREIFISFHRDGIKQRELSSAYGVTAEHIRNVVKRRCWAKATADLVKLTKKTRKAASKSKNSQLELRV